MSGLVRFVHDGIPSVFDSAFEGSDSLRSKLKKSVVANMSNCEKSSLASAVEGAVERFARKSVILSFVRDEVIAEDPGRIGRLRASLKPHSQWTRRCRCVGGKRRQSVEEYIRNMVVVGKDDDFECDRRVVMEEERVEMFSLPVGEEGFSRGIT
jgi:hypothetical protein